MVREIKKFAQAVVQYVRDASVRSNDGALSPTAQHALAKRWAKAAREGSPAALARVLIPGVVDDTIFYLLHAIDEGLLKISFTASNSETVDLTAEGQSELAGWYAGSDG